MSIHLCIDCNNPRDRRSQRCMSCEYLRRASPLCEVIEHGIRCTDVSYSKGMCNKHSIRMRRHGSPSIPGRSANLEFIIRAAWTETDACIIPPWYRGQRPVVKVHGVRRSAARQAWIERYGDPGPRSVLHSCSEGSGEDGCINVRHLYLGNDANNTQDRRAAGRTRTPDVRGESHGQAKLTDRDVRTIRSWAAQGRSHDDIAKFFPVSRRTVSKIVSRQAWAWLET